MEVIIIPFTDKVMQDRKNIANESMCVLSYMMYNIILYLCTCTTVRQQTKQYTCTTQHNTTRDNSF